MSDSAAETDPAPGPGDPAAASPQAPSAPPPQSTPLRPVAPLLRAFLIVGLTLLSFYLLIAGRNFLIPLVLAVFIWYLINTLQDAIHGLNLRGRQMPRWLAFVVALGVIVWMLIGLGNVVSSNFNQVVQAAPSYERNLSRLTSRAFAALPIDEPENLGGYFQQVDLAEVVSRVASTLASLVGDAGLIAAYLVFLFLEQQVFDKKLAAMIRDPVRRRQVASLIRRIDDDIRTYVGLKSLVSLMTAGLSYAIMAYVGLDFAEFWAILIFILNFIPNIGSLIATLLPSLLALVQFEQLDPFFIVAGGVTAVQLGVANIVEPRLLGQSLNLSPLVIILALVMWGSLWGIAGMFLCVPILVVAMIILSYFPATRPVAILLSRDGQLETE